jgi:Flp pilus assembly protein TadD
MELQGANSLIIVVCSAVLTLPLCAQVPTDVTPELARRASGPTDEAQYREVHFANKPANRGDAATVSVDSLRHPLSKKARGMLQNARLAMDSGDHHAAIEQLTLTLAKYPDSATYVHSLLGVEYMRIERYQDAMNSFEQAALLLPHDAVIRYDLGLSLVCNGALDRGELEVQRAIQLDPTNSRMQSLYFLLQERKKMQPKQFAAGEPALDQLVPRSPGVQAGNAPPID